MIKMTSRNRKAWRVKEKSLRWAVHYHGKYVMVKMTIFLGKVIVIAPSPSKEQLFLAAACISNGRGMLDIIQEDFQDRLSHHKKNKIRLATVGEIVMARLKKELVEKKLDTPSALLSRIAFYEGLRSQSKLELI